jgi:hypothetical protein
MFKERREYMRSFVDRNENLEVLITEWEIKNQVDAYKKLIVLPAVGVIVSLGINQIIEWSTIPNQLPRWLRLVDVLNLEFGVISFSAFVVFLWVLVDTYLDLQCLEDCLPKPKQPTKEVS